MNEPLKFYDRTIKLPCENLESGRSRQAELDARIKEEITSLTEGSGHWQSESDKDDRGNLAVTLKSRTCVVSLQTRYGQNEKYIARERHSFICYEIRAENRIVTLDRAADSAENLRLIMKIIGGITGPIMLFGLFYNFAIAGICHHPLRAYLCCLGWRRVGRRKTRGPAWLGDGTPRRTA